MKLSKKEIVLNWILYSSNKTYNYTTYNYIKGYVDKYYMDMVVLCSYLYQKGDDSSRIIMAACRGDLKNFLESILKKALKNGNYDSSLEYVSVLRSYEEVFLSNNVNMYRKENKVNKDSYLVSLLLKWLNGSGVYTKDSEAYHEFVSLIDSYPEDVLNALFIGSITNKNMLKKLVIAINNKKENEFVEKVRVLDRNAQITYKDKYKVLKNKFILALEENLNNTHEDYEEAFLQSEEDEYVRNWLCGVENGIQNTLVNWWKEISSYKEESPEYNLVFEYILNNYDEVLEAMFVMYLLGINISYVFNSVASKDKETLDKIVHSYIFEGENISKGFVNESNKREFLVKLERRK